MTTQLHTMSCQAFVLGGNIGSGKTTACKAVAEALDACYVPEPVEEWRSSGKLQAFYDDPVSNGYDFQTYAMLSRISALNARLAQWRHAHDGSNPEILILDRWLDDDMAFGNVTHENGNMTAEQFERYCKEHAKAKRQTGGGLLKSHKTIWLNASPKTCLARLNQRGREEEHGITLDYLQALENAKLKTDFTVDAEDHTAADVAQRIIDIIRRA